MAIGFAYLDGKLILADWSKIIDEWRNDYGETTEIEPEEIPPELSARDESETA